MHTVRDYVPLELIGFFRREAQYCVFGSHTGETSSEHVPTLATLVRPRTSFPQSPRVCQAVGVRDSQQRLIRSDAGCASRRKKLANA